MVSVSARSMRPYVKRGWCERFVNSQRISGQQALDVSKLITLELVHRLFIDSSARVARPVAANPNLVTHASRE
jgi:hypothetical protein